MNKTIIPLEETHSGTADVTQSWTLPHRRFSICWALAVPDAWSDSSPCRMQFGDTADWKSALWCGIRLIRQSFFIAVIAFAAAGCGSRKPTQQSTDFFTSGSREADQRASQRMAQAEQLSGSGEDAGEKGVKKPDGTNGVPKAEEKQSLYERLGSEAGISNIVADFLARAMQDPRVNWDRKGVKEGGFSFHSGKSETWNPTPENVAALQKHMVQFLSLTTGGPSEYQGKEIQTSHADMHISNAEFDATLGDLKSSLDKLQVPNKEQKELLAIIESTRPQIVSER